MKLRLTLVAAAIAAAAVPALAVAVPASATTSGGCAVGPHLVFACSFASSSSNGFTYSSSTVTINGVTYTSP